MSFSRITHESVERKKKLWCVAEYIWSKRHITSQINMHEMSESEYRLSQVRGESDCVSESEPRLAPCAAEDFQNTHKYTRKNSTVHSTRGYSVQYAGIGCVFVRI